MQDLILKKQTNLLIFLIILLAFLLRIIWLDKYPPSLYSDEVSYAYNAYSILKTGKDEHGIFLPVSLRAFGNWGPPLQAYLMIPSIALFGLKEVSVRIPNALLGTFSILISYLLVKELFFENKNREKMALLTAFLLTISPWHLHQSRSAMLVLVALFFFMLAIFAFLRSLRKRGYLYLSGLSFALSIYAYFGMQLTVFLFFLFLFYRYFKTLLLIKKTVIFAAVLSLVLLVPLIISFLNEPNVIFGRAKNISIFSDQGIKLKIWELQTEDGIQRIGVKSSLFFHNKPYLYSLDIIKRFFSHFDGRFLFLTGDLAAPFLIPNMGILYLIEIIFFPLGLIYLIKNKEINKDLLIIWLVISIIPASLTFMTPTQNRTFNAIFPFTFLSAYGVINLTNGLKRHIIIWSTFLTIIYLFSFHYYLVNYYKILPYNYSHQWLYGFRELTSYLNENKGKFTKILFLPKTGMSYIYLLFYNQYPPEKYQIEAKHDYVPDEFGFEHVAGFNMYSFFRNERSWEEIENQMEKGQIYIGREEEIPKEAAKKEIFYPNGKVAFRITYL